MGSGLLRSRQTDHVFQTNRGPLQIHTPISTNISNQSSLTANISVKDQWIVLGGDNFLWLPIEYRSDVTAVYGNATAIGCKLGRLLILEFKI